MSSRTPGRRPGPHNGLLAGRYALGEEIGRGRSTVYRGEDLRLRRQVAVKQVRLDTSPEPAGNTRARAMREAHAAARLSNPRAVTVFDVVEERGSIWLVMELVDAPSLAEMVATHGPLGHRRAAAIGIDVLDALRAAHAVGVVHRDVKPANVLVGTGDRAKLTDFGVASIRDDAKLTATGHIIGSPAYMAPEQARGEAVGPPADLWALGATLYFAVEGVSPFPGTSAIAVATAVVHGRRRQPTRAGPLTDIIDRLLCKDPRQRPAAGQLRRALRRARRSSPLDPSTATVVLPQSAAVDRTPPIPPPLGSAAARAGAVARDGAVAGDADRTEVFPKLTTAQSAESDGGDASNSSTGPGRDEWNAGDVATGLAAEQSLAHHDVSAATARKPAVSHDPGAAEPVGTVPDVSVPKPVHAAPVASASSDPTDGQRHTSEAPTATAFPGDEEPDAAAPTARGAGTVPADADDLATTREEAPSGGSGEARELPTKTGTGVAGTASTPTLSGVAERGQETLGPPVTNRQGPERTGSEISGGRGARLVMLVGGTLGGLAILALAVLPTSDNGGDGDSDQAADNKAANETMADTGGDAGTAPDHTAATTATMDVRTTNPTATTEIGAAQARQSTAGPQVPDGWIVFADPEGTYSIAHPPGWEVAIGSRDHTVFIREPGTGTYLLVEWTPDPKPDPVADWEEQSKYFASRHEGYEELRIEPFPYRDYNAAIWEFRYRIGGTVLHASDLNLITAGRAYALYFQTHEQRWHSSQTTFTAFRRAFNPAP